VAGVGRGGVVAVAATVFMGSGANFAAVHASCV